MKRGRPESKKIVCPCAHCGAEVERTPARAQQSLTHGWKVFCSHQCQGAYTAQTNAVRTQVLALLKADQRAADIARQLKITKERVRQIIQSAEVPYDTNRGQRLSKKCENPACQNLITGRPSQVARKRFCGHLCAGACYPGRVLVTRPCAGCGQRITRPQSGFRSAKTYCSRSCRFTHANPAHALARNAQSEAHATTDESRDTAARKTSPTGLASHDAADRANKAPHAAAPS